MKISSKESVHIYIQKRIVESIELIIFVSESTIEKNYLEKV